MSESSKVASRIMHVRKQKKLSQQEFAVEIGITQGALSQLESGKSTLSLPTMQQISKVYNVDCNWLLHGGEFQKKLKTMTKDSVEKKELVNHRSFPVESLIPLVAQEAHAGYIKQCDDQEYLSALGVYKIPGFENGNYRMFEIEGDSMVPTIHPREIVVTERFPEDEDIENGTLCVAVTSEGIVAKRYYLYEDDPDNVLLKSDNPDYKTYAVPKDDVIEIWAIKGKITNVITNASANNIQRLDEIETDIQELKKRLNSLSAKDSDSKGM